MRPKVTIGVCVRNSQQFVREAISSILDQDFPHELMEVIFVDDGSEDETLSIINSYVPRMDIKVKVFHHEWKGLGPSRNVVVDNASGDYIIWVDGDMILPRDHVMKQVEFMNKNPKVGIAKARHGMMDQESVVAVLENVPFMVYDSKDGSVNSKLPGTGGSIYRVEAIRQVSGFDSGMRGVGEDQDAAFRIREAGWILKRSSAIFYERRVQTWDGVWRKWFWYGFGDYDLYCKNRGVFSLFRMTPLAGFVNGFLYIADAYRLIRRKSVILLPFHFAFEMAAWCTGFVSGDIRKGLQKMD